MKLRMTTHTHTTRHDTINYITNKYFSIIYYVIYYIIYYVIFHWINKINILLKKLFLQKLIITNLYYIILTCYGLKDLEFFSSLFVFFLSNFYFSYKLRMKASV